MPEAYASLLNPDELVQLELDLIDVMRSQGFVIEEIKLIGLKGSGDFSSVFTVMINGIHHALKVYRLEESFRREVAKLHRMVPRDRTLFIWPAKKNRFNYHIVVTEGPEGQLLSEHMLTPVVSERLGDTLINLHSLRYGKRRHVTIHSIQRLFDEARVDAAAHGRLFSEIGHERIERVIDGAKDYVDRHKKTFRVQQSRTHNDLWWANIIVAQEDVYLIDWENLGRDDYAKDLAFFRIMTFYERSISPVSMWDGEPDIPTLEAFWKPILERYPQEFADDTFWQRYGLYALQWSMLNFGRAYYGDRRGVRPAANIALTGIRLFEDLCLGTEAAG